MAKTIVKYRTRRIKAKRSRGRGGFTLPLAVVAGFTPLAYGMAEDFKGGGIERLLAGLSTRLTGYDPILRRWKGDRLWQTAGGIIAGIMMHKLAGRLGVNRALAKSGIPFLRI